MEGKTKKYRLKEALRKAIELYLRDRCEDFGYVYVEEIILSKDFRKADIYLKNPDGTDCYKIIKKINSEKRTLNQYLIKNFMSRYTPIINFKEIPPINE